MDAKIAGLLLFAAGCGVAVAYAVTKIPDVDDLVPILAGGATTFGVGYMSRSVLIHAVATDPEVQSWARGSAAPQSREARA